MATLQFPGIVPFERLSPRSSPPPLRAVLEHIFSNIGDSLWLVGGTALSGYYAEHRLSDDLDLFAANSITFRETTLLVKSLAGMGATLSGIRTSPYFAHTDVSYLNHKFTIDIVLDEHLHRFGKCHHAKDGVLVANIPTLFSMKTACLVSRCSEKDLFDLDWLIAHAKNFNIHDMVEMGAEVDGGLNVETLLISLKGTRLRKEACHFLLENFGITVDEAFKKIATLQQYLIATLLEFEKKSPLSEAVLALKESVKLNKKMD